MSQTVVKSLDIPDNVSVSSVGKTVKVTGEKGTLIRDFSHAPISIKVDEKIFVSSDSTRRKTASLVGTISSHINNMIKGVTKGFTYRLKVVSAHFPITVKVEGNKIIIENFIGERSPRVANIVGNTEVNVEGDDLFVRGINIEAVAQTAANIEQATIVKVKDPRKFLDGIYVYNKSEGY